MLFIHAIRHRITVSHKHLCIRLCCENLALVGSSGVASMEQMEQLLPRAAQNHLRNSCKSDEIFWRWEWGGVNKRGICNARLRQYWHWYKYLVENIWHVIEDRKVYNYVLLYYCIVQMNYLVDFHLQYTWNLFGVLTFMNLQLTVAFS